MYILLGSCKSERKISRNILGTFLRFNPSFPISVTHTANVRHTCVIGTSSEEKFAVLSRELVTKVPKTITESAKLSSEDSQTPHQPTSRKQENLESIR